MKKLQITLIFILFCLIANSQTMYYWYNGERISITIDRNNLHIVADNEFQESVRSNQLFQTFNLEIDVERGVQNMERLRFESDLSAQEYTEIVDLLSQNRHVRHVFPFFERGGNAEPIGTSYIFYLQLRELSDTTLLINVAERRNVQIVKQIPYMPEWYILSILNSNFNNSIEASNYFFETGYFEAVDPAFMFNFRTNCVNDLMFNQLWGLRNTSNQGIDINVCNAWTTTRGAGVNVAVLDQGIDPNHNDLRHNFHSLSFNARPNAPVFSPSAHHGTHVAGTIGAIRNNNLQVVGVAPESRIMRVSHPLSINNTISAELASGISWAWQNGADVINNSWGDHGGRFYNDLRSTVLENAINNALFFGRNGRGSVVVFASGNGGLSNRVDYPGSFHNDILVVGSIDANGRRSSFSNHGNQLDVVAPGNNILSTTNSNNTSRLNGTSMAAPHVAGVAALILSVNPNLTVQQVRYIIESTAQKLPNYTFNIQRPNGTWNNQVGHGLVNAYAAVRKAQVICADVVVEFRDVTLGRSGTVRSCGSINVENVTVTNNARLTLDAPGTVRLGPGFRVEAGSSLMVKPE